MSYNESIANRIREALVDQPSVEEKTMFSGLCFMVDAKMCICVSREEIMCRIGPKAVEEVIEKEGCRKMIHNGREMKGYVFVREEVIKTKKDLDYWINLSLTFNKEAKPSAKKRKK